MQIKLIRPVLFGIVLLFVMMTAGIGSADEVDVDFVSHLGGTIYDVAVAGDYAYIGQGQDLVVLDISDKSNQLVVGKVTTSSIINYVAVSGEYAYVTCWDKGLVIVDITNPSSPMIAGSYIPSYDGIANTVTVSGDYVYVGVLNGFDILDITNPSSPIKVGEYRHTTYPSAYGSVNAVSGNYAYYIGSNFLGFEIVDIRNPSSPIRVCSYTGIAYPRDVTVLGNYAYLTGEYQDLAILNITNASSPTFVGSYSSNDASSNDLAVSGNYAYIANSNSGDNGLTIIDITNISSPKLVGKCDTGYSSHVALSDNHAFVVNSENGLSIVDIANASSPKIVSSFNSIYSARRVSLLGDYAYIADESQGMSVVDISDPSSPKFVGKDSISGTTYAIATSGNYAYLASGDSNLLVVDISNPSSPKIVSSCYTGYSYYSTDITLANNCAFIAYNGGLAVVDIADPLLPKLIGSYKVGDIVNGVAVEGNYAYAALRDGGFIVLDISNPAVPTLIGKYSDSYSPSGIAVSGNRVYLANGGLAIVDVSDRSSPSLVVRFSVPAQGVNVSGNYAYVSALFNGLYVVDITNPASPTIAAHYATAGISFNSCIRDNYVYVADGGNGLVILKTEKQTPEPEKNVIPTTNPVSVIDTNSLTPTISWTYNDADGDPQQQYELEVWTGRGGTGTRVWSTSQSSMYTSVTYGGNTLTGGAAYYIRVKAYDGSDWSEWSETRFVPFSDLVSKVKNQISIMNKNDPRSYFDEEEASRYMRTIGILKNEEYITYLNNVELYRNLQSKMLQDALVQAKKGDTAKVERDLKLAAIYRNNAYISFENAVNLYISVLNKGIFVAKEVQTGSLIAFRIVGTAAGLPPGALEALDIIVMVYDDFIIDGKTVDQVGWDVVKDIVLDRIFSKCTTFPGLEGKTMDEYLSSPELWRGHTAKEIYLTLSNALKSDEAATIVFVELQKQFPDITQEAATQIWEQMTNQIDKLLNSELTSLEARLKSPGELRVCDSQGRVTGLVNGETVEDIPNSVYDSENKSVIILNATDLYKYDVVGTGTGEYGLDVLSIKGMNYSPVSLQNTIVPNEVHQYTVDWNNISTERVVALDIDSNNDGSFDINENMQLPTASFKVTQSASNLVNFNGSSSTGNVVSYNWDFGDGTNGSGVIVDHTYATSGVYNVVLTVSNEYGKDSCSKVINIADNININDWNPWNDPDSDGGESITLSELQQAIYDWRFGIPASTGETVNLSRLQELIYSWRFG